MQKAILKSRLKEYLGALDLEITSVNFSKKDWSNSAAQYYEQAVSIISPRSVSAEIAIGSTAHALIIMSNEILDGVNGYVIHEVNDLNGMALTFWQRVAKNEWVCIDGKSGAIEEM